MTITKPTRRLTTLCRGAAHAYCLEGCACNCHFQVEASSELTQLAYELWRAKDAFRLPQETPEERQERMLKLLRSLPLTVDFKHHTAESLLPHLLKVVARDYWSLREVAAELGVAARF